MPIRTSWDRIRKLRLTNQWTSLECHVWNKVKYFLILIVIFSILVEWSYHGILGRPFSVFYGIYVKCFTIKKYLATTEIFIFWTENVILTFCVTNWVWMSPLTDHLFGILKQPLILQEFILVRIEFLRPFSC